MYPVPKVAQNQVHMKISRAPHCLLPTHSHSCLPSRKRVRTLHFLVIILRFSSGRSGNSTANWGTASAVPSKIGLNPLGTTVTARPSFDERYQLPFQICFRRSPTLLLKTRNCGRTRIAPKERSAIRTTKSIISLWLPFSSIRECARIIIATLWHLFPLLVQSLFQQ